MGLDDGYTQTIDGKTTEHGIEVSMFDSFNNQSAYPLTQQSRTVFQMSAGAFWIPEFVDDTLQFIADNDLWQHPEFAPYKDLMLDPASFGLSYETLQPVTRGAVNAMIETVLYKDGPSMLSSMQDFNFMYLGSMQFPFVATTGSIAVIGSGGSSPDGLDVQNVHLPEVQQVSNAALIRYDSSLMATSYAALLAAFGVFDISNVYWQFPMDRFDDNRVVGNWLLAMESGSDVDGYIALRRDDTCMNAVVDGVMTCGAMEQMYALFVGNSDEYLRCATFYYLIYG